ncbi:hypothetical protein [Burkholderia mayonis]|uniref:hypothetical protein n=1 Tax=Burkholderia mayonis TaxID=1385591 RepID=UPI000A86B2FA|nr:hypothetical protein [Burkholderia mayonis]
MPKMQRLGRHASYVDNRPIPDSPAHAMTNPASLFFPQSDAADPVAMTRHAIACIDTFTVAFN